MSFLDNAKKAFGFNVDDNYEDDRDYEYEDYEPEKKVTRNLFSLFAGRSEDDYEDEYEDEAPSGRTDYSSYYGTSSKSRYSSASSYASKSQIKYNPSSSNTEVVLVTLTNFDDSEKIVREVKDGKITIFDVSEIDSTEDARRIVDYISGAAAGMECPFSRLCNGIFCIAPKGTKITAKKSRYM